MWNKLCKAEKDMLKSSNAVRHRYRAIYVQNRKTFNRECQRTKRNFIKNKQVEIDNLDSGNSQQFWKEIGKIGIGKERRKYIPMEVVLPDGTISTHVNDVLETWKGSFNQLLNPITSYQHDESRIPNNLDDENDNEGYLNDVIHLNEIKAALHRMKDNKAEGIDEIPSEVLKNHHLLNVLSSLFNQCFTLGKIPDLWKCGIITPVVKSSTTDTRDPLSYRGITITPAIYKLYCNILNNRLMKWESEHSVLHDAQNGFRKGRSTIDQVLSLTSLIDTRKLKRQSTFVAFIDFSKAYDSVNRHILFTKLLELGITGRIHRFIVSLYDNVKCCVRINGLKTDFFLS